MQQKAGSTYTLIRALPDNHTLLLSNRAESAMKAETLPISDANEETQCEGTCALPPLKEKIACKSGATSYVKNG